MDQVYRPGYGHLAAALGPCWPAHDLCLYALDIACGLWSVLYLQPGRDPALLSAQAEYQARILPALAAQLMTETTRCGHHPRTPAPPEHAMTDDTLRQALAYAARGWPVFPCQPGQKIPATTHGYRDATTDPGQITAWFARRPECNLAIATGAPGPDVLDVDQHGPAGNGYAALVRLRDAGLLDGAAALRPHPQRRHARLLHRHRPAQRPPARPPPGLPVRRRLRPGPALSRSAARPTGSCGNPAATAA